MLNLIFNSPCFLTHPSMTLLTSFPMNKSINLCHKFFFKPIIFNTNVDIVLPISMIITILDYFKSVFIVFFCKCGEGIWVITFLCNKLYIDIIRGGFTMNICLNNKCFAIKFENINNCFWNFTIFICELNCLLTWNHNFSTHFLSSELWGFNIRVELIMRFFESFDGNNFKGLSI